MEIKDQTFPLVDLKSYSQFGYGQHLPNWASEFLPRFPASFSVLQRTEEILQRGEFTANTGVLLTYCTEICIKCKSNTSVLNTHRRSQPTIPQSHIIHISYKVNIIEGRGCNCPPPPQTLIRKAEGQNVPKFQFFMYIEVFLLPPIFSTKLNLTKNSFATNVHGL